MPNAEPVRLQTGVTHDVCDQEHALPGWTQDYRQLAPGRFVGEVSGMAARGMRLFREVTNLRLQQYTAPPPGTIALGMPLPGSDPSRFEGKVVGDGDIMLFAQPTPTEFMCSGRMNVLAVSVECDFLRDMKLALPDLDELRGNGAFFSPLTVELRNWLFWLMDDLSRDDAQRADPRRKGAFQLAIWDRCVLALEAMVASRRDGGRGLVPSQRHALVNRVREYVRAHPDDLMSVAQIAQALGVSTRMLEYCFADVVGISPNAYLRMIRLNAARRELLAADPRATTVAEVAMNHGFWHLGRFSTYYHQMFGEKPSDTLRQTGRLRPPSG
ncbi:MAG TPA: helix-turn-helix domain-containing protein [Azospirillum sp.]